MKFKESTNNKNKLRIYKIACLLMFLFGVSLVEAKQQKFEMMIDKAPDTSKKLWELKGPNLIQLAGNTCESN